MQIQEKTQYEFKNKLKTIVKDFQQCLSTSFSAWTSNNKGPDMVSYKSKYFIKIKIQVH